MNTRGTTLRILLGSIVLLIALAGCLDFASDGDGPLNGDDGDGDIPSAAQATLTNQDGEHAGTVSFHQDGDLVRVVATVGNLSTGFHGFHIHGNGACEPAFTDAGGHFAPDGNEHGDHAGDMPVLLVNGDGTGVHAFVTDRFTIEDLVTDNGTALIIHEGPDNYANIPDRYGGPDEDTLAAGDAGPREACGVIEGTEDADDLPSPGTEVATADLADADGNNVGAVTFTEADGAIRVTATIDEFSPGFHGFHIHETGLCNPTFDLAGGHHNPGENNHGDHAGDMPVLLVTENGTAELTFTTDRYDAGELDDLDGSAVIVHAGPDNYANIPDRYGGPDEDTNGAGDAGARDACGTVNVENGLVQS